MLVRVLKIGDWYYPQYKGFWEWKDIKDARSLISDRPISLSRRTMAEAVEDCEKFVAGRLVDEGEVVWQSNGGI